jgi:imidazolonepropionase-like amidohydrolase
MRFTASLALIALSLGCATTSETPNDEKKDEPKPPPMAVFEMPTPPATPARKVTKGAVLINGATVMTAAGDIHRPGHVLVVDGNIAAVGPGDGKAPAGATVVDGEGKFVTPGIIDTHSHIGVYPSPWANAHSDGNEAVGPTTPGVWAEHGFWPQDPNIWRAVSGGVTTIQVLPGSANLIGGRSFTAKLKPGVSQREMRFEGAPQGLKMACGENPKRVYGQKSGPQTRMGNTYGFRRVWQQATEYKRKWDQYDRDLAFWKAQQAKDGAEKKDPPSPPGRDLNMETLKLALEGTIKIHNHCYRADDISKMLDLSEEFGFTIRSIHHALEAYKIRDRLAKMKVSASTWADWWGFKMEAFDGIPQNLAMLSQAGAIAIVHSDSANEIRHLNHEAAKARTYGRRVGIEVDDNELLRWITHNPAWAIGVDDKVGTLEVGKHADLVLWSANPFSIYARAEQVYIDGGLVFDRDKRDWHISDFELGHHDARVPQSTKAPKGGAK